MGRKKRCLAESCSDHRTRVRLDRYQEAEDVLSSYLKTFRNRHTLGQLIRVGFTGVGNTIVYFALLNLFLHPLGRFWAITVGNVVAISISYVLNRRWSFRIDDGSLGNARESAIFFAVNLIGWALAIFITELSNGLRGSLAESHLTSEREATLGV